MPISEVTRRNIFDELLVRRTWWWGRLSELSFLERLYDLTELPSNDRRFKSMWSDIHQHRVNNQDWEDDWLFQDHRLGLMTDDQRFLKFLAELVHPAVRPDTSESQILVGTFNRYLAADGWKIVQSGHISGCPVYAAVSIEGELDTHRAEDLQTDFARSQFRKCEEKIAALDFDGAITSARSLLERVMADLVELSSGVPVNRGGSLQEGFKALRKEFAFCDDKSADDSLKGLLRSLTGLIDSLDNVSNDMGDRHVRRVSPSRHHAVLCVNSAKTLVTFFRDAAEIELQSRR